MIAFVTSSLRYPISISILIYTNLSIFTIGYTINNKPFERKSHNLIEIFNESFILISGYFLIIFSDWIYNPEAFYKDENCNDPITVYNYGYAYIVFVVLIVSLNMSFILYEQYKSII